MRVRVDVGVGMELMNCQRDSLPGVLQDDYIVIEKQPGVMAVDSSPSSRPVVIHVTHPDQINQAFDSITYNKASSPFLATCSN